MPTLLAANPREDVSTSWADPTRCPEVASAATVRPMDAADALLAARLAAGDDDALAEVFDRLAPAVYGAAMRVLGESAAAQDIVQDVFVELWSRPDRYNPHAGTLRTYLTVVARYRALDAARSDLRRVARQRRHHELMPHEPPTSPSDEVTSAATASAVRDAVNRLPDDQRRVVEMAYFQGMTFREVAVAVGIPEGTAKSRIRRALANLENVLDRQLLESP
jgi:RNA polymerase sigma-70 factor, ECF subfamily